MQLITSQKLSKQIGANAVEYGLVMALITALMLGAASYMNAPIGEFFECAGEKVASLVTGKSSSCGFLKPGNEKPIQAGIGSIIIKGVTKFCQKFPNICGRAPPKRKPGGKGPVAAGKVGEDAVRAVYDIGEKTRILINGKYRIPDGIKKGVLSEVKNQAKLSYTQQLRDFAAYAKQTGRQFHLYIRSNTQLSKPLQDAIAAGTIKVRIIPGM